MENIGTRNAKKYRYDKKQAVESIKLNKTVQWKRLDGKIDEAISWYQDRGNPGDGIDVNALESLQTAVRKEQRDDAVKASIRLLNGRMHPTARDIVGAAAKQAIYSITGIRAYKFEVDK